MRNQRSSRVLPRALENANDAVVDCVARTSELPCSIATTTTTAISERTCCMHSGASERNLRPTVSFLLFPLFLYSTYRSWFLRLLSLASNCVHFFPGSRFLSGLFFTAFRIDDAASDTSALLLHFCSARPLHV